MFSWRSLGILINIGAIIMYCILGIQTFDSINQHMIWHISYYFYALYFVMGGLFYFLNDLKQMKIFRILSIFVFSLLVILIVDQLVSNIEDMGSSTSEYEKIDRSYLREENQTLEYERQPIKQEFNLIWFAIIIGINSLISVLNIVISFCCSKNLLSEQQKLTKDLSYAFQTFDTENKYLDRSLKNEQIKTESSKIEINSYLSL